MGFNVGFQPYAGYKLSCQFNGRSLIWKENRSTWRKNYSWFARYTDRTWSHLPEAYLSTFRNFIGGDSARIDVFDPFFFFLMTKCAGKISWNFHGGDIFLTYKQA